MYGRKKSISFTERIKLGFCCIRKAKVGAATTKNDRNMTNTFTEHTWDIEKISSYFNQSNIDVQVPSRSTGLTTTNATNLLNKNGPNMLPKPKEITNIQLFISQFMNLLWALLLTADVLSFISYLADTSQLINLWCAVIIFIMIVFMCCVSFYQEREARLVVKSFENLLPDQCMAIRDGKEIFVEAKDLVVGDLIKVSGGTKVAADARLIICSGLKVETSSITGESEPIDYQVEEVPPNINIFEAHNIILNGSLVIEGEGVGVVIRTGTATVIGQIATMTTGQKDNKSLLELQMIRFVKFLVVLATAIALIAFIIGGFVHKWKNVIQLLCNGFLVCAIGMVPCGFPATVTSIITVVARRLASKQVYLKKLDICEAIGSCNIIASDKTGTLTKNVMTVTDVWYCNHKVPGLPNDEDLTDPMYRMLEIMGICNFAKFTDQKKKGPLMVEVGPSTGEKMKTAMKSMICGKDKDGFDAESQIVDIHTLDLSEKSALGTPSEVAMLRYSDKLVDLAQLQRENDVVFEIPFNSRRKWHLLIIKDDELPNGECQYKLLIKGASEIVIKMCNEIYTKDGVTPITDTEMAYFDEAYSYYGSNGRRIIGFAETRFMAPSNIKFDLEKGNFPLTDLTFVGFCAIMDPPKDETADAIKQCREAGIKVFMVTGDHQITATAIGKEIGLIEDCPGAEKDWETICGEEVSRLSSADWDRLIQMKALIFARTTPEQKLLIVEECQKKKTNYCNDWRWCK
jgi:sodium/potassium-transporting ATPase subunit alpha